MRALSLIRALSATGDIASHWGHPNGSVDPEFARRIEQWLDRHGAALGCLAIVLTFIGAIELIRHLVALL